jgi:hypothetical protein
MTGALPDGSSGRRSLVSSDNFEQAGRINAIFDSYVAAMTAVRNGESHTADRTLAQIENRLLALEAFVEAAILRLAQDAGVDVDAFLEELGRAVADVRDLYDDGHRKGN